MEKIVRIGVGVIVINSDNKILIGKRKGSHGEGKYGFPGGHQEFSEKIEETAIRELKEETDLEAKISDIKLYLFTDDYMESENKHYITFFPTLKKYRGNFQNMEPHKCEEWIWLNWKEIKGIGDKLFLPIQNFIQKYPDFDPEKI